MRNAPSQKVVIPTVAGAIATLTLALVHGNALDPHTVSVALCTIVGAVITYLSPHKPLPRPRPRRPGHRQRQRNPAQEFTTLYDTTTPTTLGRLRVVTSSTDVVLAAYDDGRYNDVWEMRKDFPGHHVYTIAVFAQDNGDFLDCEPGDATPDQVCDWIERRRREGARFIGVYADATRWQQIFTMANARGVRLMTEPHQVGVCKWIADPTGVPHIPAGYEGCQWGWPGRGSAGNFDKSLFYTSALR